jgi:hypothetical protein
MERRVPARPDAKTPSREGTFCDVGIFAGDRPIRNNDVPSPSTAYQ